MTKPAESLLEQLIDERARLLAEHPHLRPFQKEIDSALEQAGVDPEARLQKTFEMLTDILNEELAPELTRLKELIDESLNDQKSQSQRRRRSG